MPYVEVITEAGRTVEVERYYTARYGIRGQPRREKIKPTAEEQKRINDKQAEKKLRRLINANFGEGDFHIVLSYARARGDPHRTAGKMKEDIAKFLRELRKQYRIQGMELKYIHVAEVGERGARHHHLVVNKSDIGLIQKCWPHGRIHVNPLDATGNYAQLAAYLIKYTSKTIGTEQKLQGKRWNASKNLIHPIPAVKVITERAWYRTQARIPPKYRGRYYIDQDSIDIGVHSPEYSGFGYFRFTMVMLC